MRQTKGSQTSSETDSKLGQTRRLQRGWKYYKLNWGRDYKVGEIDWKLGQRLQSGIEIINWCTIVYSRDVKTKPFLQIVTVL